jgi:hypothetical protein
MANYVHTWSDFREAHPEFGDDQFDERVAAALAGTLLNSSTGRFFNNHAGLSARCLCDGFAC